jgi:hypothetical protein
MKNVLRFALPTITAICWAVLVWAALPNGWDLTAEAGLLVQTVACMGSVVLLLRSHAAPVVEVYMAGKLAGRNEVLAEQQSGVTHLPERRLSVVNGG